MQNDGRHHEREQGTRGRLTQAARIDEEIKSSLLWRSDMCHRRCFVSWPGGIRLSQLLQLATADRSNRVAILWVLPAGEVGPRYSDLSYEVQSTVYSTASRGGARLRLAEQDSYQVSSRIASSSANAYKGMQWGEKRTLHAKPASHAGCANVVWFKPFSE